MSFQCLGPSICGVRLASVWLWREILNKVAENKSNNDLLLLIVQPDLSLEITLFDRLNELVVPLP